MERDPEGGSGGQTLERGNPTSQGPTLQMGGGYQRGGYQAEFQKQPQKHLGACLKRLMLTTGGSGCWRDGSPRLLTLVTARCPQACIWGTWVVSVGPS